MGWSGGHAHRHAFPCKMTILRAEGKQGLRAFIYRYGVKPRLDIQGLRAFIYQYGVKPRLDIKARVEHVARYQVKYAMHIS